jgi:hypothetical protein
MKTLLIEFALNKLVDLLKNNKSPKVKEFILKQSTFTTIAEISKTYFQLYDRLKHENRDNITQ